MFEYKDGKSYRLDIIDTAGQEEYRDMLGSLFSADSSIDAYLLVYDITSRTSLENLEIFDELIEKNLESGLRPHGSPMPVKIVAGNKSDLSESRVISSSEGLAWAKAHGCGFMETSAKVMVNIEETFEIIIRQVNRNRIEATGGSVPSNTNTNNNNTNGNSSSKNKKDTNNNNNNNTSKSNLFGLSQHNEKDNNNNTTNTITSANTTSKTNNNNNNSNSNNNNTSATSSSGLPRRNSKTIEKTNAAETSEPKKRGCCIIC